MTEECTQVRVWLDQKSADLNTEKDLTLKLKSKIIDLENLTERLNATILGLQKDIKLLEETIESQKQSIKERLVEIESRAEVNAKLEAQVERL